MPQRLIKIVLSKDQQKTAVEILDKQENITYWLEESTSTQVIFSTLLDSGHTETIMDAFERKFGKTEGFKLVVFPVEATIPREKEPEKKDQETKSKKKTSLRISREELYADIVDSSKLNNVYLVMAALSAIVVIVGLLKNNPAVIIGAMVIAPFLGPNVALSLSNVLADRKLGSDAFRTLVAGIGLVLIIAFIAGASVKVDPSIPEIASRTAPDMWDILLALASGAAGVLAFTTGASAVVIGVMVAVALLPPLTVFGLLLGSGEFTLAIGALLVFLTNIICINLAGVATFLLQGVTPRTWWEAKKAKKAIRLSITYWVITLVILTIIIYSWSQ
jgi:uncharacterized hydrophobic protein (TIGR00341 family)